MKKRNKILVILSAALLLSTSSTSAICYKNNNIFNKREKFFNNFDELNNRNIEKNTTVENTYHVAVGPNNVRNIDECNILLDLSETQYQSLKNDLQDLRNRSLEGIDLVDEQLKIFRKYNILPEYFTLDNLTKAIEEYQFECSQNNYNKINTLSYNENGRTTFGPHLIIYASLLNAVVNFQPLGRFVLPPPMFDIIKILEMFNIKQGSMLHTLLYNTTLFHYLMWTPCEILIGGSLGHYFSIPLFPGVQSYEFSNTPFIGVYLPMFVGGIYIFNGQENREDGTDNALFDFFIGISLFSMVNYG